MSDRDEFAADRLRQLVAWFASGETGMSSEAIACHMAGMPLRYAWCAPSDPADLGRCLRLLELFPEWKPRMGEMAQHGADWAALVPHWEELAQMMANEVGINWSKASRAPQTYNAMRMYLDGAQP